METARFDDAIRFPAPPFLAQWTRLLPLTLAVVGATSVYLAVQTWAPPDGRLAQLILQRGWTQPLTLGLFFWGLGHVIRRLLVQVGERRALQSCRELLGHEALHRRDIPRLVGAVFPLRDSLSGPIVHSVLTYFRSARPTRDEVSQIASQEMDRAYDKVEADYRPLSATMWLLPLAGFLGTVIGMAEAIGGFDQVINGLGGDLASLMPSVEGLAKAFDTTLLALGLVVPLKLAEVGVEGRDRRLLEAMDQAVGTGYVRTLDLAVLAQKTPEQEALDRLAAVTDRIERNLGAIDHALASIGARMQAMPDLGDTLDELVDAARTTKQAMPRICAELDSLVRQGDAPLIVSRRRDPRREP